MPGYLLNSFFFLFQPFATAPYVFLTAVHAVKNKHDASSVWAEDVTRYNFRACLRELKNFDGAHKYLSVVRSCSFCTQIFKDLFGEITVHSYLKPDAEISLHDCKQT